MRGRKPKPSHLKILQGTARRDRTNTNEPVFKKLTVMRPPTWLSPEAKKSFKVLAKMLTEAGVLQVSDKMVLSLLCEQYQTFLAADKIVKAEGMHYTMPGGQMRVHPAVKIRHDAQQQIRQFAVEFGLTPSSRSRVSVTDVTGSKDPLEEFLDRK